MQKQKVRFVLVLSILIMSFNSEAQSKDEKAIREFFNYSLQTWNAGDLDAFMTGYEKSDSTLFMSRTTLDWGYKNSMEAYRKAFPTKEDMGKLSYDLKLIKRLSKKYYFVVGTFTVERKKGNFSGNFSVLMKKIKGKWLSIVDHS